MYWKAQVFPVEHLHRICYDCNICTVMHYVFYSLYYMFSLLCVLECNKESWSNKGWLIIIILQGCNFLSKAVPESEEPIASSHLLLCEDFILLADEGMVIALEAALGDSWPCVVTGEEGKEDCVPFIVSRLYCLIQAPSSCHPCSGYVIKGKHRHVHWKPSKLFSHLFS